MKQKIGLRLFIVFAMLALAFTAVVCTVDRAPIGPNGTVVGLATFNAAFRDAAGVHLMWYDITDILGKAALLLAAFFTGIAFLQCIRRRSIRKTDKNLRVLVLIYILVMLMYVFFEVVIINYRPIILPGCAEVEASFPSSHTMLAIVVYGSAAAVIGDYIGAGAARVLRIILSALLAVTVLGRIVSGVHWITDIIAGVLYALTFLFLYFACREKK